MRVYIFLYKIMCSYYKIVYRIIWFITDDKYYKKVITPNSFYSIQTYELCGLS